MARSDHKGRAAGVARGTSVKKDAAAGGLGRRGAKNGAEWRGARWRA